MEYENKVVVVTGGASGIGLGCVKNYLERGASVAAIDVNPEALDQIKTELSPYGDRLFTVVCDVTDFKQVEKARDAVKEKFGRIDILLCVAGGAELRMKGITSEFKNVPMDVFDFGLDLNLKGAFYWNYAALAVMAEQKSGVIVNFGSVTGIEGSSSNIAYATAKAGIIGGLTPSVAMYGARYNVRCVCVTPGPILTRPGMARMTTLMKRAGEVQELVDTVLFLTSDKASFITGQNFIVDGGRLITENKTFGLNDK